MITDKVMTKAKISSTTSSPTTTTLKPTTKTTFTISPTTKLEQTTRLRTSTKTSPPSTTRRTTQKLRVTTPKVQFETTVRTSTPRPTQRFTMTATGGQHHLEAIFGVAIQPDAALDNEAETIPNIEIIPFVAHDAIDTDKFQSYHKPYDNLEKDYFANEKEKPFRYNNKFIHHSYDDAADYAYTNPHERIDNGPYYFETNDNQFDAFSPPSEQDFLGKARPSIYL